ncbi:MAG: hypothetical protein OJF55_002238 [Rhodanobacteraceae bacterium]|jgi:hypothetical protein|nr:MAG: hypothetical protein OJF55_002238 [Rhodanobacteraceae bacterium]
MGKHRRQGNLSRVPLTPVAAQRIVRRIAQDSGRVYFLKHAIGRMRMRSIQRDQVLEGLRRGTIHEGPALDIKGRWRFTMHHYSAGDELDIVASLDWDAERSEEVIVVTVFEG